MAYSQAAKAAATSSSHRVTGRNSDIGPHVQSVFLRRVPTPVKPLTTVGLLGGHLVAVELLGVDVGAFWQQMQQTLELSDVNEGIIKSLVFGLVASLVAVWEGYNAIPTAEGVGRATTRTVVVTAIAVLFFDFMITAAVL